MLWHVDNLKLSHVDGNCNKKLLGRLNPWYGTETLLGDLHEYLGMTIDYSEAGKVKIRMDDYVENLLNKADDNEDRKANTPAAELLIKVNPQATKLDKGASDEFHSTTAKLLFLCKQACPDIQTPVAFLCTRVSCPDVDDNKKLRKIIIYLRGTRQM